MKPTLSTNKTGKRSKSRHTIRIRDGGLHHDFPSTFVKKDEESMIYHRIEDSYPIKAVSHNGIRGEVLYSTGTKRSCQIVEKIEWFDLWELQIYCIKNKKSNKLILIGALTDMIEFSGNEVEVKINEGDTKIAVNFDNGHWRFEVIDHPNEYKLTSAGNSISKNYNKKSDFLRLGYNNKINNVKLK